jgi:hypothetical protein
MPARPMTQSESGLPENSRLGAHHSAGVLFAQCGPRKLSKWMTAARIVRRQSSEPAWSGSIAPPPHPWAVLQPKGCSGDHDPDRENDAGTIEVDESETPWFVVYRSAPPHQSLLRREKLPPRKICAIRGSLRILEELSSIRVRPCPSTSVSLDIGLVYVLFGCRVLQGEDACSPSIKIGLGSSKSPILVWNCTQRTEERTEEISAVADAIPPYVLRPRDNCCSVPGSKRSVGIVPTG